MNFEFIPAKEEDRAYLLDLRKRTMVEHLENAGMFLSETEHLVRLNDAYHCSHLIRFEQHIIGTLKYRQHADSVEVMQLQIHPDFQRQSFGRKVLEQVIREASQKKVRLTVLKDNPARHLYARLGFSIYGEDQHEYFMTT